MWLIMCIISSVANLLAVITTGVWLDHLNHGMKDRTGLANGLSGLMLLGSVLVGKRMSPDGVRSGFRCLLHTDFGLNLPLLGVEFH